MLINVARERDLGHAQILRAPQCFFRHRPYSEVAVMQKNALMLAGTNTKELV